VGIPEFVGESKVNDGAKLDRLGFKQPLSVVVPPKTGSETILCAFDQPIATAVIAGKGRVIVCGARRLFMQYGKLAERKQGITDDIIEQQKGLLVFWMKWLAEKSPARDKAAVGLSDSVPGRVHLTADQIDVYCIPQLSDQAKQMMSHWQHVWRDLEAHTGLTSPLELVNGVPPGQKLQIYLRTAKAGGLSGGIRISIAGLGEVWRPTAVLGHEVGHKLLGGCNTSVSEAFAEWLSARAMVAAGFKEQGRDKLNKHIAEFLKADPNHSTLDIADPMTDIKQSRACLGKWLWILTKLQDKYGKDFIKNYVAALRKNVKLAGPARKFLPDGRRGKLTMSDHVRALSQAAGEDLTPWFRELGITVEEQLRRKRRHKDSQ